MSDKIASAMAWLRGKQDEFLSREVTYSGVRDGETISATITVGIGTSQLTQINSLGMEQGLGDFTLANPAEVDRDYIVTAADLRSAGLWPPSSGDLIDDTNDLSGVINRYRVMSIPGQSPWRYLRGSYTDQARVHSRFFAPFSELWSDAFTGTNGTDLTSHTPDSPASGTYSGGLNQVLITSNRIRAGVGAAYNYTYFNHGSEESTTTQAKWCLNGITAANLEGTFAKMGLGVRVATSGAGIRAGYYCTLKVAYASGVQTTTLILDTSTLVLSTEIGLSTVYQLVIENDIENNAITLTLADETGEVSIASLSRSSALYSGVTGTAIYFEHGNALAQYATPYMDDLTVTE